jgi:hypothetical protein
MIIPDLDCGYEGMMGVFLSGRGNHIMWKSKMERKEREIAYQ